MKWINKLKNKFKSNSSKVYTANELDLGDRHKYIEKIKLEKNLEKNIQNIKELYGNSFDLNIRRFKIGKNNIKCALVYMTGAVSTSSIEEILDKLEIELLQREYILKENKINLDLIIDNVLNNKYIEKTNQLIKILNNISLG
ncbi:MAG: spore germination protein, partial [Halanaerobiaceae bacterium]